MAMPQLDKTMCELVHINIGSENHGDQKVQYFDLKWVTSVPPTFLDMLVPEMREHFFKESNSSGAMKGGLQVRCPELGDEFSVDRDIPGYTLSIDVGAVSGAVQEWTDVKLRNQKVKLIDGGAVQYTFFARLHGDPDYLKEATPLLNKKLPVTLTPPGEEPLPKHHPDSEESRKASKAAQAALDKAKGIGKATNGEAGAAAGGNQVQPPIGEGQAPAGDPFEGAKLQPDGGGDAKAPGAEGPAGTSLDKLSEDARKAAAKSPSTRPPKPGVH